MTETALRLPARINAAGLIFPAAVFLSASLVFLVEPMTARLLLPKLGGSPAVWNVSMAFFQAMLLAGYGYAHLLQKLNRPALQAGLHMAALVAAGAALPLHLNGALGDPSPDAPIPWLLGVLMLSVGAPFAVLSATAPLVQAWFVQSQPAPGGRPPNPYPLYAASNLGSMLALLAYPFVVEPLLALKAQALLWTAGYALFFLLIGGLVMLQSGSWAQPAASAKVRVAAAGAVSWRQRLSWTLLAAAPSSLMLGVTTYISTDVAAAPFLWVMPLALYLATFIIAFQASPAIKPQAALLAQGVLAPLCLASLPIGRMSWALILPIHLSAFFFTALVCHQAMAARRPAPEQLTQFYLFVSLGGVIGGAATAFLAPAVFNLVLEYPLVLVLAAFARPATRQAWSDMLLTAVALAAVAALFFTARHGPVTNLAILCTVTAGVAAALLLRQRRLALAVALGCLAIQWLCAEGVSGIIHTDRSFFGVNRVGVASAPALGGQVHTLIHGTTLHGSQAVSPQFQCRPVSYYTRLGGIGGAVAGLQAARPNLRMGVVGLGAGGMATYVRPGDTMRYFEIDPEVERIARNPHYFTYLSACAKGPVAVVLGDARMTLAREPAGAYDFLLLDAFTSDAIPTHLLTAEALNEYLGRLKPDGVLLLHISNRNLALDGPLAATAAEIGAVAMIQHYRPDPARDPAAVASDVLLVSRSQSVLDRYRKDPRWRLADTHGARAWSDDYTNIAGALIARALQRRDGVG